ncbi:MULTISPECIES: glutathione synthase [Hyphomonas]|jgi:glutathione synthase|uniref:Glutathione synthetase n=1 Tax=Hyphomonas adhaerens TaxID=81029 RepID=A0A3B9GVN8_9PROT|nr:MULTISPECIES: glutathione synthase [Hyphomonas]MBB39827.1 glutathione synthase [Hyphomonas sp.]HAE26519.1 glutathione synthase [Hyphomonas adhaerens]|tara:strand:- start:1393 stop:2343 length:951 start_codon:yes stop_codon:yes gene_type:complete
MSLRVAIQMDPLEHVNIDGDTTFALAETAQARGMEIFVYGPQDMSLEGTRVTARVRPAKVQRVPGTPGVFGEAVTLDLAKDIDVVLMRQDPPFDLSYITACHMLELISGETLVLNDPEGVRSSPEKILPLMFPDLMPPTLVSRDPAAIEDFRDRYKDIIVKPIYGHGGAGVFRLKQDDSNLDSLLELFFSNSREPVMVQAFLPAVSEGDKRIMLVDGKAVGALNRRPKSGQVRSNLVVGGTAEKSDLSEADKRICDAIGPELRQRGLVLTGIDVIGGRLTEINVTSPTGVQAIKKLSGIDIPAIFWDSVQERLAGR